MQPSALVVTPLLKIEISLSTATPIPRSPAGPSAPRRRYLVIFSLFVAVFVLAGFTRTFFVPLARHSFAAPWFVYVHGTLFFTWIGLLVTQTSLVASRNVALHRRLGLLAVALIPLMVASGLTVAFWATARDYRAGGDAATISFFFGELLDMFMFASFAIAAFLTRRRPQWHKRLILLATLAVFGAAVGRLPIVGAASNYITLAFLAAVLGYDLLSQRRLHLMTLLGGAALMVGTFTEDIIGSTPQWLAIGTRLISHVPYGALPPN